MTQTTPYGRKTETQGYPIKVCEMLSTLDGTAYAERVSVDDIKNIKKAKAAIKKAFEYQIDKKRLFNCRGAVHLSDQLGPFPKESIAWLRRT